MNQYQQTLYDQLIALTSTTDAFFFADHTHERIKYRIFNYRLASYSLFCLPSAQECRGIMFELDECGDAIRLAALPMHKFYNLHENPFTMDVDLTTVDRIMVKSDGSLISTYMHGSEMRLKSKGSLASVQAIDAMEWLNKYENIDFKMDLLHFTLNGHTVNLEWVGPDNRIVLGYEQSALIVLNIRDTATGLYRPASMSTFIDYSYPNVKTDDVVSFVESVPRMTDSIEGFVCITTDGLWFKLKTEKYLSLHRTKDSINCPRRLFDACVDDAVDDMRSMFYDDPQAIVLIDEMQEFVDTRYNHMVSTVETFFATNERYDRKDFAITAGQELTKQEFGLVMNLYMQRPVDYKASMKKNWKNYGISNEKTETK